MGSIFNEIVFSEEFLKLPITTRLFYISLCASTDTDDYVYKEKLEELLTPKFGYSNEDIKNLLKLRLIFLCEDEDEDEGAIIVVRHPVIYNELKRGGEYGK
jgi:hypothetical protein